MWLIIRNPIGSISCSAAHAMCCWAMSASVQCVATRATEAPSACAAFKSVSVPIPGSSSAAIRASCTAPAAASISAASGWAERPYWIEEPPTPSPCETSITSTPARSSPAATAATCSGVNE